MAALRNRFVSYRASTFGPGIQLCSPACSSSCCDDAAARSFRRLKPVHRMLDWWNRPSWNNASLKRSLSLCRLFPPTFPMLFLYYYFITYFRRFTQESRVCWLAISERFRNVLLFFFTFKQSRESSDYDRICVIITNGIVSTNIEDTLIVGTICIDMYTRVYTFAQDCVFSRDEWNFSSYDQLDY